MIEFENHDIIIELTPEGRDGASVTARGEWEADEHYYYLDIVSYNGGSYLAKTDVPAGTLPTNTTYWQVVASNAKWGEITGDLSDQEDLQAALDNKADAGSVYTKTEADALLANKADKNSVYTKTEADALLAGKANASDVYTKTQVDDALDLKADKADSYTKDELDGIFDGIDNALDSKADADSVYTKSQTNTLLAAKANTADVYNKTAVDNALAGKADKSDTYTKAQTDDLLSAKANSADLGTMATEDAGNYYNKTETDTLLGAKANSADLGTMSAESASDYYDKTEVNDLINNSGVVAELDASGSIATFETNLAENLSRLNVSIDPVQDLHGYDSPWPAGGGKNLLDVSTAIGTQDGKTFALSSNFGITVSGSASATVFRLAKANLSLAQSTSYIANGMSADIKLRFQLYDGTNTLTREIYATNIDASFTTSASEVKANVVIVVSNNATGTVYPMLRLASVSDASFAPYSNICPISGHSSATVTRTGKNLVEASGELNVGGNGKVVSETGYTGIIAKVKQGQTYTTSKNGTAVVPQCMGYYTNYPEVGNTSYDGTRIIPVSGTFTAPIDGYVLARMATTVQTGYQIEFGESATEYEAPDIESVTIDLDGTRYGGTLDALTGTLTVDRVMIAPATLKNGAYSIASTYYYPWVDVTAPGEFLQGLCNKLVCTTDAGMLNQKPSFVIRSSFITFSPEGHAYSTESDAITAGEAFLQNGDVQFVYPLATPTVITGLTPAQVQALVGKNYVWADTGDVAVSYFNNSTAEAITDVKQMIASTETSMTATRNYTSGSLIIVGSAMYKALSNISSGASLVLGTNCVRTTLEEWILSLIA